MPSTSLTSQRWACVASALLAAAVLAQPAPAAKAPAEFELDLSTTSEVKGVVCVPPVLVQKVTQGSFGGFDASKTVEKWNSEAFKKLLPPLSKELNDKVIPADTVLSVLAREGFKPKELRTPAGLARLAKVTNAEWVVAFELQKGALVATVFNAAGEPKGTAVRVEGAEKLPPESLQAMAKKLSAEVIALASVPKPPPPAAAASAALTPQGTVVPVTAPEEELTGDAEAEVRAAAARGPLLGAQRDRPRFTVAVGPGALLRDLKTSGAGAATLAELRSSATPGVDVWASLAPLQFIPAVRGSRFSDLALEGSYRRNFVSARGSSEGLSGQACAVVDDNLTVKGTFRYRLGEGYLPSLGLSAGYSQERTTFAATCGLPAVSTDYRGVDAQLRILQPLFRDLVSLDLAVGPRFLARGPEADRPGFSLAGEAWVQARPASILFARAGGRFSWSQLENSATLVKVADTRAFFALEVGAWF